MFDVPVSRAGQDGIQPQVMFMRDYCLSRLLSHVAWLSIS